MLALLHTGSVHVASFTRLVRERDPEVALRHVVREDLLSRAIADGGVTEATRRETQSEVERVVADGARVVLCTCSTLGGAAESTAVPVRVLRVDRPMAERAVELGRTVLVVAATATAMATALSLLHELGAPPLRELMCDDAWRQFEAGDLAGYVADIAEQVRTHARPNEVVMLAQASMAPAATSIHRADIDVLTSPRLAVEAALAALTTEESPRYRLAT